jgi:hypothetical protein
VVSKSTELAGISAWGPVQNTARYQHTWPQKTATLPLATTGSQHVRTASVRRSTAVTVVA